MWKATSRSRLSTSGAVSRPLGRDFDSGMKRHLCYSTILLYIIYPNEDRMRSSAYGTGSPVNSSLLQTRSKNNCKHISRRQLTLSSLSLAKVEEAEKRQDAPCMRVSSTRVVRFLRLFDIRVGNGLAFASAQKERSWWPQKNLSSWAGELVL